MALIPPVCKLVNDALKELLIHLFKRSFVIALAGCTELTAAVTAVDGLEIDHQRMGYLLLRIKPVYIILLALFPCLELKFKICI